MLGLFSGLEIFEHQVLGKLGKGEFFGGLALIFLRQKPEEGEVLEGLLTLGIVLFTFFKTFLLDFWRANPSLDPKIIFVLL